MGNPGKNNIFVGSRSAGPMEQSRTKQASIKHQNPEYFKRQTDRKNSDSNISSHSNALKHAKEAEKNIKFLEKHENKSIHSHEGKRDNFQPKQFSKGTMY